MSKFIGFINVFTIFNYFKQKTGLVKRIIKLFGTYLNLRNNSIKIKFYIEEIKEKRTYHYLQNFIFSLTHVDGVNHFIQVKQPNPDFYDTPIVFVMMTQNPIAKLFHLIFTLTSLKRLLHSIKKVRMFCPCAKTIWLQKLKPSIWKQFQRTFCSSFGI